MKYLILFLHLCVLLFWLRLWTRPAREFYFNPFLSGLTRLTDNILTFLRPILALPESLAAAVILIFTLLFKGLLLARLALPCEINIGSTFVFALASPHDGLGYTLLFSTLQVLFFIVHLWTLHLLVLLINPPLRTSRALEALAFIARPCSKLPLIPQVFVVLGLHFALVYLLINLPMVGQHLVAHAALNPDGGTALNALANSPFNGGALPARLLKIIWLALLSFLDGLHLLARALFACVLANLATLLWRSNLLAILSSEGIELLLGRFARRGAAAMGLDFTPLIFFFVADLLYRSGCQLLYTMINNPWLN